MAADPPAGASGLAGNGTAAQGRQAVSPCVPQTPRGGSRWVALLALQPGTASAWLRGAPIPKCGPPPTPRRRPPRLQPQTPRGFRRKARRGCGRRGRGQGPRWPQGRPGGTNPSPARRDHSVAAGRACALKAKPCAALRVAPAPALTAPTPLLAQLLPPGRKTG